MARIGPVRIWPVTPTLGIAPVMPFRVNQTCVWPKRPTYAFAHKHRYQRSDVVAHQQPQQANIPLILNAFIVPNGSYDSLFDSLPSSHCPARQLMAEAPRRGWRRGTESQLILNRYLFTAATPVAWSA